MTIFFTSDIHFSHTAMLKHCSRPWDSVEEMNQGLVDNWNEVVGEKDEVYVVGDVCMGKLRESVQWVKKLKGRKHLVAGNHDKRGRKDREFKEQFQWIKDYYELNIRDEGKKQKIILCHYPFIVWDSSHYGSWNLCGHSHGSLVDSTPAYQGAKRLDVGVDVHNYRPISYEEVKAIMATKKVFCPDHHRNKTK